jgi:1,4-dihydroxy-2-naphthoyl-CoA hydrolase
MPFVYHRTVRFQDTDAAGVVYFANLLAMCHEAYEESLRVAGIKLQSFFQSQELAVPIVHAEVDFMQPLHCGDALLIQLQAHPTHATEFEVTYEVYRQDTQRLVSRALTRHVCIQPQTRSRQPLSAALTGWLQHHSETLL